MNSHRLPGKSAMEICGKPLIWHVLSRAKHIGQRIKVILAIPCEPESKPLVYAAESLKIPTIVVANDEDLVHRYRVVAQTMAADMVIRIPGDNPCIDPDEIRRILAFYKNDPPRWNWLTTNLDRDVLQNGYPGGLGAEIYDIRLLEWLDWNLEDARLREHPHLWAYETERVATCQCPDEIRRPDLDFSVNTMSDFEFISDIYRAIHDPMNPNFRTREILDYLEGKDDGKRRNGEPTDHRHGGRLDSHELY